MGGLLTAASFFMGEVKLELAATVEAAPRAWRVIPAAPPRLPEHTTKRPSPDALAQVHLQLQSVGHTRSTELHIHKISVM